MKRQTDDLTLQSGTADYLQPEKQLADNKTYKEVKFNVKILSQLLDAGNQCFKSLRSKEHISEKELRYFTYEYKKN